MYLTTRHSSICFSGVAFIRLMLLKEYESGAVIKQLREGHLNKVKDLAASMTKTSKVGHPRHPNRMPCYENVQPHSLGDELYANDKQRELAKHQEALLTDGHRSHHQQRSEANQEKDGLARTSEQLYERLQVKDDEGVVDVRRDEEKWEAERKRTEAELGRQAEMQQVSIF